MLSTRGREIWLGIGMDFEFSAGGKYSLANGTSGEIRVLAPGSHWRMTRQPPDPAYTRPSTIQVRVISHAGKSVLAFHEEHLPSEKERSARKDFYLRVLERISGILENRPR